MRSNSLLMTILLTLVASANGWAADAKGCSDPAMFPTRMPGYDIASCKKGNDTALLRWPGGQQQVMGVITEVIYKVPSPANGASPKYIAANYANALTQIGGKLLQDPAKSTLGDRVTGQVNIEGRDVWVQVNSDSPIIGGNLQTYRVLIAQQDAGSQVVSAQKMLEELDKSGFITLYLHFDTAKSSIKPDSAGTIQEIANLLRARPQLKVAIEGHTDNVGSPASNKALSEGRSKAVLDAVVAAGIAPARLKSAGYGQERPIADNRTEEGRAKNRRVELVKLP